MGPQSPHGGAGHKPLLSALRPYCGMLKQNVVLCPSLFHAGMALGPKTGPSSFENYLYIALSKTPQP